MAEIKAVTPYNLEQPAFEPDNTMFNDVQTFYEATQTVNTPTDLKPVYNYAFASGDNQTFAHNAGSDPFTTIENSVVFTDAATVLTGFTLSSDKKYLIVPKTAKYYVSFMIPVFGNGYINEISGFTYNKTANKKGDIYDMYTSGISDSNAPGKFGDVVLKGSGIITLTQGNERGINIRTNSYTQGGSYQVIANYTPSSAGDFRRGVNKFYFNISEIPLI